MMLIFGLCFFFLRRYTFTGIEDIKKIPQADLLRIGICCLVCACILIPLPIFLFSCCRSQYYLVQADKDTDIGGSEEENS